MRWLRSLWPMFEQDSVQIKIKVKTGDQSYSGICWYKVYGYWKFKSDFLWKSMGMIESKLNYGKYDRSMDQRFLRIAEDQFFRCGGKTLNNSRIKTIPMEEVVRRLEST